MIQKATTKFTSVCGKANISVENDMPIGIFHDFLMQVKGEMINRMVEAHQQQISEMEEQKKQDDAQPKEE